MRAGFVGIAAFVSALVAGCVATSAPDGESGGGYKGIEAGAGGGPASGGAKGSGGEPPTGAAGEAPIGDVGGAAGTAGSGVGGGSSACGDNYCDTSIGESCSTCPADCYCNQGGSSGVGGTTAGGGTGGGSTGLHQDVLDRAKSGVGFSYWWGHGRFLPEGPNSSNAGDCTGSCPSCTHTGSYGGDCSGFVAKVWQVPASNTDMTVDDHPYSTFDFVDDTSEWSTIPQGSLQAADAMVYNNGSAGHIFIYSHGDPWGSMYAYECKGCSYGCTAGFRTASTSYHAIRRTGY